LITEEEDLMLRKKYTDGWLSFKRAKDYLTEKVLAFVWPIQQKFAIISDEAVSALLAKNAIVANELASKKIQDVYQKVWFVV
jgi:tryptophanyl-tRNA synthetase